MADIITTALNDDDTNPAYVRIFLNKRSGRMVIALGPDAVDGLDTLLCNTDLSDIIDGGSGYAPDDAIRVSNTVAEIRSQMGKLIRGW